MTYGPNQNGRNTVTGALRRSPQRSLRCRRHCGSVNGEEWRPAVLEDFTRSVLSERARLALLSPQDEPAALSPLTEEQAWALIVTVERAEHT